MSANNSERNGHVSRMDDEVMMTNRDATRGSCNLSVKCRQRKEVVIDV